MGTCDIALERDSAQQSYLLSFPRNMSNRNGVCESSESKSTCGNGTIEQAWKGWRQRCKKKCCTYFYYFSNSMCLMLSFDLRSPCTPQGRCWQWLFVQPSSALVLIDFLTALIPLIRLTGFSWLAVCRNPEKRSDQTITTRMYRCLIRPDVNTSYVIELWTILVLAFRNHSML